MKLFKLLIAVLYVLPFLGQAQGQVSITAVATNASCVGNGTLTVTVTNVAAPITYGVAKLPYNEATVIASLDPVFTHLAAGDYYYGYYDGTTFVKAGTSINVGSSYSTASPTITRLSAKNYTYCGNETDPLGNVTVYFSGGNAPYTISLLKASDNSEVQKITTSDSYYTFTGLQPETYSAKLVDNCGVTTTGISNVTLAANVTLTSDDIVLRAQSSSVFVNIVYNTAGDICSGIKSASLSHGLYAVCSPYFNPKPDFIGSTSGFRYKLEIWNGTNWDTYDDLTLDQVSQSFSLPADRSKWGVLRITATFCGFTKTVSVDLGASDAGKPLPFKDFDFRIVDDPANTNCTTTGKVKLEGEGFFGSNFKFIGCLPYTLEVTDNDTQNKTSYTVATGRIADVNCLLDIGKTYTIKLTDRTGAEIENYRFLNYTNRIYTKVPTKDPNNVFINPATFTPNPSDLKSKIQFYTGPSAQYFGKSALGMYGPIAPSTPDGLEGQVTVSLESGPSALTVVQDRYDNSLFKLGNDLTPGTYKIRVRDSGCFNEVFDVVLDTYFTGIEITSLSSVPLATVCDRYKITARVTVSDVGDGYIDSNLSRMYGNEIISVSTVSGPAFGDGSVYVWGGYGTVSLQAGTCDFIYLTPQVSGTYEIGLSKKSVSNRFLLPSEVWENTTTKTIKVEPNFPTFDLSQSGGIICTGNTTGDLYVKVDNAVGTVTYFLKRETDASYPATGQTSPVFTGLTAGNYVVKAKTSCYEVEQPLILRIPLTKMVSGTTSYCDGGSLSLAVNQAGPVSTIKWTAPDGTTYNTAALNLDHLTAANAGSYKVEVTSLGGCYFTENFNVTMNNVQKPTGASAQVFCKTSDPKVSNLVTNETGVIWYDAATGGAIVSATTALVNGTTYYGTLQLGNCKSTSRLAVTVTVNDPQTPTGTASQTFCKNDNKKVSDLATNETGVTWYDAATAGNVVTPTTTLINNRIYYGSLKVGTCESPTRFAVTVTLNDPQTPTGTASQTFCKNDNKKVSDLVTTETGVTWYDAATNGNVVTAATTLEHNKVYYGSLKVGTCESPTRFAVTVTLNDPQTPTGTASQTFCKSDNKKVSDLATNETGVTWYDAAAAGNVVTATTALTNGTVYYGSLKVGTCESPTRFAVTVTVNDPQTPTGTASQTFCKNDNKTVADLATTETGVTWYDAATGGNVVSATTALTNGTVYYGSLKVGTCESPTRFAVTVTLNDPQTPTGTASQTFCKNDNKTVADLVTNETGVTWFDAATAGNVVTSTTALVNNRIYYGSLKVGTCESPTRFAVTVTLNDPQTPTGTASQTFCKNDNKTVADLATTETGVTWYDAATAGNVVATTTALTNGTVYYGSLKVGNCESPIRFAVTVTLNDPQTPTGTASQTFCKNDNKTVADLVTTETGVTWYDAATNGNIVTATTALVNNRIYYGSLKVGNCESPTRFAVTVTLNDPQTPTGTASQTFCKNDNKTVADLTTNETGVTWYDAATAGNVVTATTALTNGTVYYGSLKVGTCESPTRFAVTVTLNDPQTPTGTASQTFCKNDNKTVADLATNETGVTWYDAATSGNIVSATTALTNGTVYYGSLKVGNCESPTRFAVTVTLNDPQTPTGTASQTFCKNDNKTVADLATTETGVTWFDAATAGNVVSATTALTNGTVYYGSLKVGTCESPTRFAVTATLNDPQTPTGTASQTFCKNDNKTVADLVTAETGVTWYDAATAGNVVTATTTLVNNRIYYGSLKVGTCESPTRFAVTITLNDPQTPTGSASQTFCKNDNKTVADLVTSETGVTWYDAATAGNVVSATAALTNGTVYYGSLKVGTCESPIRFAVTVTLNDPQTPTGTASQTFCKSDNKTMADLATNETGVTWYDAATAGNVVSATTALTNGTIYYGSLKVATCESPTRFAVTVTLNDPQTPTGTASQTFCKNDNKTVADLVTAETGVTWYDAATAGNIVSGTTALTNGSIYYGSLKVGNCESPTRFAVIVTLNDPQTPTGTASQTFCKNDAKTVADLVTNETGVTWYDAATAGNIVTATTALVNNRIYYGSLKVGTCESPTRFAVTVTLNDPQAPTGTASQTFCKNDNKTVTDLVTNETGVTWYDAATAGNVVTATTALVNNRIYYGSLKVGTCESPTRFAVTVTLNDPQTPTGTASQTFCKNENKTVADLVTTETGVTWYDAATAGNIVSATTALTNGTVYYGSLKVGTCESPTRFAVTVTLNDPQTPTGTASQTFCKNDNKKVSDLVTNETGVTWYDAATNGNIVTATTTLTNGTVYYGSLKVGTCESPTRFAVTVTLNDPQTPTGTASQTFCKNDNKTVADLVTTETGVTWYDAATAGNIVSATAALTNGTIYYGSLKVGTCESPTRFAVTVTLNDPQTPTGTASQTFCKNDTKTVADLVTTETGVTWYDAATGGNIVSATTTLVNNRIYYGSLKVGTCESPTRFAVTVTLNDPQTPTGTASQTFCKNDNKTVADLTTNETGVTWYDAASGGNIVTSTTAIENNKIYYGSLKVGSCESPTRFAVTVTLNDPQTPTGTASQTFCKNDTKTVADLATNETGVTWYDAATAGNVVTATTVLTNGTVYYGSLKVGTCESPTRFAVTVTLNDPQTPTGTASQTFCKNDTKTVADLVTAETGVTWYDAATAGNVVIATTVLTNGTVYYGSLKVGTCESPTRFAVTVTLNDPQTPTGTASQTFCKNDTKTVADLVTAETGVTWYDAATAGNVVIATTALTNGTVYYGSLKVGTCESPTRFAVTVTLNDPQTPTGTASQTFCKNDNKTVADLVTNETNVTWYDAASGGNIVTSTTAIENNKIYYGSLKVGSCESPIRFAVKVTINNPQTPTTGFAKQEFALTDHATVAHLVTVESGVIWYDAANGGKIIPLSTLLEDGKMYYGSLKVGNCESTVRLEIKVSITNNVKEPAPPEPWNTTVCVFSEVTYKTVSGKLDYYWKVSKGTIVAGGQLSDDFVTVLWKNTGTGSIIVEYFDINKITPVVIVQSPVTINSCSDIGLKKVVDKAIASVGKQIVFTITAENLGTGTAKEIVISEQLPSGYEYVTSEVSAGNYNANDGIWNLSILNPKETQTLTITAKVKETGDYLNVVHLKTSNPADNNAENNRAEAAVKVTKVIVYNAVSPNNDGLNDYFKIDGLEEYPNNSVEIFNSGGVQIFKTSNYGNDNNVFRGISEGRATISKDSGVPTGTYFYILRYKENEKLTEKSGYLYVTN